MSVGEEITYDSPEPELPTQAMNESLVERLRKQRKAIAEQQFTDLDIPGYNGELFCRYRLLDGKELDTITQRVTRTVRDRSERVLAASLDTIILACEELWIRDGGKEIPAREAAGTDIPIRYDEKLAELMGFREELPEPSARNVVRALFNYNEIAIEAHNAILARWMMGSGVQVDMELGEL